MTTAATTDRPSFSVNLEEDPELNILAWRLDLQAIATGLATIVAPTGLLTYALTDPEW